MVKGSAIKIILARSKSSQEGRVANNQKVIIEVEEAEVEIRLYLVGTRLISIR